MGAIDADAHVLECDATFDYIEPAHRDLRPFVVVDKGEGGRLRGNAGGEQREFWVLDGRLHAKPATRDEARDQLRSLRGQTHQLLSAAVIVDTGTPVWRHVGTARLTMRPFTDSFLEDYLDRLGDLAFASVGCYQLEGLGAQLFSRVAGDYFTVLGLPLLELLGYLRVREVLLE